MIKPPTNYTGSKHNIIEQIYPNFPKDTSILIEPFFGGGSVSINSPDNIKQCYVNDIITPLIEFYQNLYKASKANNVDKEIETILSYKIEKDKDIFLKLREDFNKTNNPYQFFSLVNSCQNNLMRFNKSFKFNQTWGNRNINNNTIEKVRLYCEAFIKKDYHFYNMDYIEFLKLIINNVNNKDSIIYIDPPYFETEAGYNAFWSKKMEEDLFIWLDILDKNGFKFLLSNVSYLIKLHE